MLDNPNTIDYKGVAEMLQRENEQLRLSVLRLRYTKFSPLAALKSGNVKQFLVSNYIVIAAVGTLLFIVLALGDTVKGLIEH